MSRVAPLSEGRRFQRIVGRCAGTPGPTVLVFGGLHGNEPAGVLAAERVVSRIEERRLALRGELIAVAGNLRALEARRRFLEADLNRCWRPAAVADLQARDPQRDGVEEREQRELLEVLHEAGARSAGPVTVLDLHTTSGESPPFTIMSDTLRNRRVAFALPVPVILGLEESVDGTLLEYATENGDVAVLVEAGQHDDPAAVDLHEAVIWLTLHAAGSLALDAADLARWRKRLREASRALPRVVELRHMHRVAETNGFQMRPGFRGFQRVAEGDVLADDEGGEIRAPEAGLLVMPRYQEQGDDGFFIMRPVNRFWIFLSAVLRRLRLAWVLPLLPGVSRHPDRPQTLRVDPKVARLFVKEIFHLFGFRRRRPEGDYLVFSRRRPR